MNIFPCYLKFDEKKNKWVKGPITPFGEDWKLTAQRPLNDPNVDWARAQLTGVAVPEGCVIIDLDLQKGITTDDVDPTAPWAEAHLQNTISGGAHFGFRLPAWPVRQGQNIGIQGFDTRIGGKGFICTGKGYTGDLSRLDDLTALPVLPDSLYEKLNAVYETPAPARPSADLPQEAQHLKAALAHIDPAERSTWFQVGCALKAHDLPEMFELWDEWSSGALWSGPSPEGYEPSTQEQQWNSFKTDKASASISRGTVYWLAKSGGWIPPATFDSSAAFMNSEDVSRLYMLIMEKGSIVTETIGLVEQIRSLQGPDLMKQLLASVLKQQLSVSDKKLSTAIDDMIKPDAPEVHTGRYGPNDSVNALHFLDNHYPDTTLCRADQDFYRYTGKIWSMVSDEAIDHQVALSMISSKPSAGRVRGCAQLVKYLAPIKDGQLNSIPFKLMICQNGVYDIETNMLHPHDPSLFSTNLLPFDYNPAADCPNWRAFLTNTLGGDQELIALLQEWIGYLLTNDYTHHKVMMLIGPPRSGKGTIARILRRIVGADNYAGGSLVSFADDPFIEMIRNKSAVFISDAEKSIPRGIREHVTARIKAISGHDEIGFKRKYKSSMSETLPSRITISSNSVPRIFDDSGALSTRILLVPFFISFAGREDLALEGRLLSELSGIANWAIEGWRRLAYNGRFTRSITSETELSFVKESFSPLLQFINDSCKIGEGLRCTSRELYDTYRTWCLKEGVDQMLSHRAFTAAFKESTTGAGVRYGTVRTDSDRGRGFYNVAPAVQQQPAFRVVQ